MDRDRLDHWLAEGLSLSEIGALTDRDPSTVGYWLKKHGLEANGKAKYAPKGGLPGTSSRLASWQAKRWRRSPIVRGQHPHRPILDRALSASAPAVGAPDRDRARDGGGSPDVVSRLREARVDRVRDREQRPCQMSQVSHRTRRGVAPPSEGDADRGGWWRVPHLRLQPLPGGAAVPPPRSRAEDVFASRSAARRESMRGASSGGAKCVLLCANCHAEVEVGVSQIAWTTQIREEDSPDWIRTSTT